MAALFFERELRMRGIPAEVSSAGILLDDRPAERNAIRVLAARGLDASTHRSRRMTAEMLDRADLIVGMERAHVREAAVLSTRSYARAFTLKELVRRAEEAGPRGDEPFSTWLTHLSAGRTPADHLGRDADDEVDDPIGRGERYFRRTADEIEALVERFVDLAFPPAARGSIASDATPTTRSARP
jgi:low molecular weight protein-tyrosine phosphatase